MISPEQYIDGLEWRYACKKFDPHARIEEPTWHALAESLRLSPSSLGLQLWKFVVVTNKELKARLREVSWNQSQVEDCSHYVVLCARRTATQRDVDRYLAQIEFTRHPSAEKLASSADFYTGYVKSLTPEKMHTWLDCQVYIAAGFLLSAAAALRVDSCTIGGMDREKYDEILGLDGTPYRSAHAFKKRMSKPWALCAMSTRPSTNSRNARSASSCPGASATISSVILVIFVISSGIWQPGFTKLL